MGVGGPNLKCRILFHYFLPLSLDPENLSQRAFCLADPANPSAAPLPAPLTSSFFLLVFFLPPSLLEPQIYTNAELLEAVIKETTGAPS